MDALVVDASPLVTLLVDEPGARLVQARLEERLTSGELLVSAVNLCEVLYAVRRRAGMDAAACAARRIRSVPVRVVDADGYVATFAAELKYRHGLGLGDCFAAGLALATKSPLLTGDADFLPLVEHGLQLDWVGPEIS